MKRYAQIALFFIFITAGTASAQQSEAPKLLVVDYAMEYPAANAGVMDVFTDAGFEVHYRPYYPAMTERDAITYDVIVLMGGGDPGMSAEETELAISFVSRGKVLVLGMPPDSEYGGKRKVNPGMHDRFMFNRLMNRLNVGLYAVGKSDAAGAVLNPVVALEPNPEYSTGQGTDRPLLARPGTRILVGSGAGPLLVEPEMEETPMAETTVPEDKPEIKMVTRRIRVQASDALADEDIELLLRGPQKLRAWLYYKNREQPAPVEWSPEKLNGRVVAATMDSVTVRVSGNRWGSEYGLVAVPVSVVAVAFVKREIPEEVESENDQSSLLAGDDIGRPAVAAVGRTDRLQKGFVVAVDRYLLNTLSRPASPIGLDARNRINHERVGAFLIGMGRYIRTTLLGNPDAWSPDHPYETARLPGVSKPKFSTNNLAVLGTLPERVTVLTHRKRPADITGRSSMSPMRGVWDYVFRQEDHMSPLVASLPDLGLNFLWTVAPASSYRADSTAAQSSPLSVWGRPVAEQLDNSAVAWYTGVSTPDVSLDVYRETLNTRGEPVGLPSRFDLSYLKRYLFEPSRLIARYSLEHPAVKGIVHDWDTHINRDAASYSNTDAFEDENFRYFVRYLAKNGLYRGDDFNMVKKLERGDRFEWLMKSGHLEAYFQLLTANAERLGKLYRQTLDEINPNLHHGAFIRSLQPSWFHIGFWRGVGTPERPFIVMTYERPPPWYQSFLREHGVSVRIVPIALLGLMEGDHAAEVLQTAADQGSYGLERSLWLVNEPTGETDPSAPPESLPRNMLLNAIRSANSN